MTHPIYKTTYLDSHATTRVDQDVLNSMVPFFVEHYGNGNHRAGRRTAVAMEYARFRVSRLMKARPSEVVFTSGATEAINLGILGLAKADTSGRKHIVTQQTEHKAVLQCVEELKKQGYRVTVLGVDAVGRIDLDELRSVVTEDTLLVAIMLANNEIGTVQPVREVGAICKEAGARFFCDLTQGIGWHPVDVDAMNIDVAAISAHKIHGPRGVGALFMRKRHNRVHLSPLHFGGGQERGLRPGTTNIPAIVGFGKACELQFRNASRNTAHIRMLRDRLQSYLFSAIEGIKLNGCPHYRHPGNLNISIPHVTGEELIGALPHLIFSNSSACTSGSSEPSHVISALGVSEEVLKGAFRIGISKSLTIEDIDHVGEQIVHAVKRLQAKRTQAPLPNILIL